MWCSSNAYENYGGASGHCRGLIRGTQRSTQAWAPTPIQEITIQQAPRNTKVVLGYINIDRNMDSKTKVILLSCT